MLDTIDSLRINRLEPAYPYVAPRHGAVHARGYAGPERRSAAAAHQRRMAQMIDTIDYGMVLMADTERVAVANKAARRAMDATHPLALVDDELHARSTQDGQRLREAIAAAADRGLRRLVQLGEGRSRVSVAVVPLPDANDPSRHGVLLLMGRRQVCEELTVDWYARAHGLTLAETAVIRGLCADLTPQEIAARQGVGLATIRTQIGSIRTKTGAGSIRALVRQIALLPPLVSALGAMPGGLNGSPVPTGNGSADRLAALLS